MATDSQFISTSGIVQKFPEKPVVTEREVSGQTVNEFTIRALQSGKLVRITLWPEFGQNTVDKVQQGAMVGVDGPFNVSESNGKTYYNMTARSLTIVSPEPKAERQVVNQTAGTDTAGGTEDRPF